MSNHGIDLDDTVASGERRLRTEEVTVGRDPRRVHRPSRHISYCSGCLSVALPRRRQQHITGEMGLGDFQPNSGFCAGPSSIVWAKGIINKLMRNAKLNGMNADTPRCLTGYVQPRWLRPNKELSSHLVTFCTFLSAPPRPSLPQPTSIPSCALMSRSTQGTYLQIREGQRSLPRQLVTTWSTQTLGASSDRTR